MLTWITLLRRGLDQALDGVEHGVTEGPSDVPENVVAMFNFAQTPHHLAVQLPLALEEDGSLREPLEMDAGLVGKALEEPHVKVEDKGVRESHCAAQREGCTTLSHT
eukprot:9912815-Lingulodinium_polyedra.AAC.1